MGWNGTERNGTERNGTDWDGIGWDGMGCHQVRKQGTNLPLVTRGAARRGLIFPSQHHRGGGGRPYDVECSHTSARRSVAILPSSSARETMLVIFLFYPPTAAAAAATVAYVQQQQQS